MTKGRSTKTSKAVAGSVAGSLGSLGDYLKEQRLASRLSLRQLADQVGVSNPYLSQIERGLRRPSAEVLQQLAKALRISAEQLYVRAGIVHPDAERAGSVELAILDDGQLTERQKQSLLDVYASFLALNASTLAVVTGVADAADVDVPDDADVPDDEHDEESAPQY